MSQGTCRLLTSFPQFPAQIPLFCRLFPLTYKIAVSYTPTVEKQYLIIHL